MKVADKVMVVTGGGNGLGRELVLSLLARGARVAAIDLNEAALATTAELAADKQSSLTTHLANITDKATLESVTQQIIAEHGVVDGLINNAGIIQPFVKLAELDDAVIERVMNVNFFATLSLCRIFLPHLLKRPQAHICNISSMGGFLPVPGQTIYGASKAAVKLMTEGLHSELQDTSVAVTLVLPGAMKTNIAQNSGIDMSDFSAGNQQEYSALPAAEAAKKIIDGIEKNRYRILVGSDAVFMDLIYRLNPQWAAQFIYKKMRSLLGA
ncbi:MAG: SDR family NAD(P)-dependent oxidoreductase [Gammaproteobacteria bacterium]|nr:SDR family NAD(P)-dependent oxidoreductase [Gammaproteobacteria bacterium]